MSGTSQNTLAAALGVYETAELVHVVQNLKQAQSFLLDRFFPTMVESDTPEVAIDVDDGKRRLAPFCSPLVEGKVVESRQFRTVKFAPPYIKDKRTPDLMRPLRRAIGERLLGGTQSPIQRMEANIAFELQDQIDMITRRMEWMAAQVLRTGKLVVRGDGYPSPIQIDFGRSASLTPALAGAAAWGQPGVSPTAWLIQWATQVLQQSGAAITDLIFTNSPWNAFTADIKAVNAILTPRGGDTQLDLGGQAPKGGLAMGRWGQFRLWLYNDWFVDPDTGVEQPMLPDGTVLACSDQMEGLRSFGAIADPEFNYGPLAYAPKMWTIKDPAQLVMMMQSAPMVIPSRVNACLAATVMAANGSVTQPNF